MKSRLLMLRRMGRTKPASSFFRHLGFMFTIDTEDRIYDIMRPQRAVYAFRLAMTKENKRTKESIATVATTVGDVVALSTKHRPFAERQDFAIDGGLNGVCQASRVLQQQLT